VEGKTLQRRLTNLKNLAALVGWAGLFVYSVLLLVDSLTGAKPPSILYLLLPVPLLLVTIRATVRFVRSRA
jgi:hypothetical protein